MTQTRVEGMTLTGGLKSGVRIKRDSTELPVRPGLSCYSPPYRHPLTAVCGLLTLVRRNGLPSARRKSLPPVRRGPMHQPTLTD
jgi:hypothetical protein